MNSIQSELLGQIKKPTLSRQQGPTQPVINTLLAHKRKGHPIEHVRSHQRGRDTNFIADKIILLMAKPIGGLRATRKACFIQCCLIKVPDHLHRGMTHHNLGLALKRCQLPLQLVGCIQIIGIQKSKVLTRSMGHPKGTGYARAIVLAARMR